MSHPLVEKDVVDYGSVTCRKPGLSTGVERIFDLGGNLNRCRHHIGASPYFIDQAALSSDWLQIGRDLRSAMHRFAEEEL